jgi:hypothetical protein
MSVFRVCLPLFCLFCTPLPAQDSAGIPVPLPAADEGLPGTGPVRRMDWFKKLWEQKQSE